VMQTVHCLRCIVAFHSFVASPVIPCSLCRQCILLGDSRFRNSHSKRMRIEQPRLFYGFDATAANFPFEALPCGH
jgi:hypothetical protein